MYLANASPHDLSALPTTARESAQNLRCVSLGLTEYCSIEGEAYLPQYQPPPGYHGAGTLIVAAAEMLKEEDFHHTEVRLTKRYINEDPKEDSVRRTIKSVAYRLPFATPNARGHYGSWIKPTGQ